MPRTFAIVALLASLALAGCVEWDSQAERVQAGVHERFAVTPNAQVRIENVAGPIVVVPWSRPAIDIVATKHASDARNLRLITIEVARDGTPVSDVDIRTHYAHMGFFGIPGFGRSGGTVDYTVHVPTGAWLHVANVSGDIRVSGMSNDVEVNEVSGDITAMHLGGDATIHAVSGSIDASLRHMGDGQRVHLDTVSGSISLGVPPNSSAVVSAQSISGSFHSDFPIPAHQQTVGVSAQGRIGNGAGSIEMRSISGSLTLSKNL